jgi:hypothetical protein
MVDFLKLSVFCTQLINYLYSHNLLEWVKSEDRLNLFDKEVIKTKTVKQYKGILFCFYENRIDILFKPHCYFNGGLHNANDFTVTDCIKTINEFKNTLQIDLKLLKVVNIEFGINILSPICIKTLITSLLYHKRNEFRTDKLAFSKKSFKPTPNGTMNRHKSINGYAKTIQCPNYCVINTFRFEVNSKRSKYINKLGISTADDLLGFDRYLNISNEIKKEFDKVLLLELETDFSNLSEIEQAKFKNYLNTTTWYYISQDPYKNRFNKERAKYNILVKKIPNNLKNTLTKIIWEKIEYLKTGYVSTENETITKPSENNKSGYISNIYKDGNVTTLMFQPPK